MPQFFGVFAGVGNDYFGNLDGYVSFVIREGDDLGWLGYFLGKSETLEALNMSEEAIGVNRIGAFIEGLKQNQSIEEMHRDNDPEFTMLGIRADYPDDEDDFTITWGGDMGWLGFFVAKNSTLQSLYIDINDTPESEFLSILDRIGVFIEGLNRNRSIEKLHIGSDLGSENFRRMGDFFSNNSNLRELSFRNFDTMGVDSALRTC